MSFDYLKKFLPPHPEYDGTIRNWFYPLKEKEIEKGEKILGFSFPSQLKQFWREIGYGCLGVPHNPPKNYDFSGSNRIQTPSDITDILTLGYESGLMAESTYEMLEEGDLPFFEMYDSTHFMVLKTKSNNPNAVWTHTGVFIEDSLEQFIWNLYYKHPSYYGEIIEEDCNKLEEKKEE